MVDVANTPMNQLNTASVDGQTVHCVGCGRNIWVKINNFGQILNYATLAGAGGQTLGAYIACEPVYDQTGWYTIIPSPAMTTITTHLTITGGWPIPTVSLVAVDNGAPQPAVTIQPTQIQIGQAIVQSWQVPTGHKVYVTAVLDNGIGTPPTLTSQTVST